MDKEFEYISNETKKKIGPMDVVLPSLYSSIFSEIAQREHVALDGEERLSGMLLDDKINQFTTLSEQTSRQVSRLSDSASKAVDAMEERNMSLLQEVLAETRALRAEVEELRSAIHEDPLTKVQNRKWFNDTYLTPNEQRLRLGGVIALIDLNHFRRINERLGHISGDKILVYIAGQLKRSGAKVVRYGGDEFLLLFEGSITAEEARKKLHIIRELVLKKTLKVKDVSFKTSFSYGIAAFREGDLFERLVMSLDTAMYADKQKIKERLAPPFED